MSDRSLLNFNYWSRRILLSYGVIILLAIAFEVIAWLITRKLYSGPQVPFFIEKVVIPTVIQGGLIALASVVMRFVNKTISIYILIVCGDGIALTLILNNPNVSGLELALLLPMAVSLIFFRMRVLVISFVLCLLSFMMIYLMLPAFESRILQYEFIANACLLCAGYSIYYTVMQREIEVLGSLQRAIDTEQELRIEKTIMDKLSKTDALTGLYNHRTFQEYLDHLVDQGTRYPMPIQLAIIDIDHFKTINDSFGHNIGDIILRRVAEQVYEAVTVNDIVARYGGEEFAVIFTGKTAEESYRIAENMRLAISRLSHPEMDGRCATVSIGLQDYLPGGSKSELFAEADALLYKAKRDGRNRTVMRSQGEPRGREQE